MSKYLNRPYRFREASREKEVTVDFPITVSPKHRISFRDAKKLFKYLKENRLLRKGVSYFVTDSEGNETNWDYPNRLIFLEFYIVIRINIFSVSTCISYFKM